MRSETLRIWYPKAKTPIRYPIHTLSIRYQYRPGNWNWNWNWNWNLEGEGEWEEEREREEEVDSVHRGANMRQPNNDRSTTVVRPSTVRSTPAPAPALDPALDPEPKDKGQKQKTSPGLSPATPSAAPPPPNQPEDIPYQAIVDVYPSAPGGASSPPSSATRPQNRGYSPPPFRRFGHKSLDLGHKHISLRGSGRPGKSRPLKRPFYTRGGIW